MTVCFSMVNDKDSFQFAYHGALAADALAMPVHWYYDREALKRDYGRVDRYLKPHNPHADSILWRSNYQASSPETDILRDQAKYWGQRGIHYHQFLKKGENTLNFKLARSLYISVKENGVYDADAWLELYIKNMLTPGWHNDTYVEEYHRAFFINYGLKRKPRACGIDDQHIGGLAQVPALLAALPDTDCAEMRQIVQLHVSLTHRNKEVLAAADCLVKLLYALRSNGADLESALAQEACDYFSLAKSKKWALRPDEEIVGQVMSSACYIADAFPASLYLSWKYRLDPREGLIANAMVGGDNCHRGAVVGSLLGACASELFVF